MFDMLIILGAAMPEKEVIDQLENALLEYRLDHSDRSKSKLMMSCMLLLSKHQTGDSLDKAMAGIKRIQEIEARDKMHTPSTES